MRMKDLCLLLLAVLAVGCHSSGLGRAPVPAGLTYALDPAVYTVGKAIDANAPSLASGTAIAWSVSPVLPAGLALDASTGVLKGTPTAIAAKAIYTVSAANAGGSTTAHLTLTVNPAPPVIGTAPASTTVAFGQSAQFRVVATGTGPLSYQWQKDGADIPGATSDRYTTPPVTHGDEGATFRALVTDGYGGTVTSPDATLGVLPGELVALPYVGEGRYGHMAVALKDGRVLVLGGRGGAGLVAVAEVFDPATKAFSATPGAPLQPRFGATATLLADGRVLVAGGWNLVGYVGAAEVFDPSTGQFLSSGSLKHPRAHHTATLLANGTVLIAGGMDTQALASAEVFDPAGGAFRLCPGSLEIGRAFHTATPLPDGRVLLAGGRGVAALATTELFDPGAEAFGRGPVLAEARYLHTATLLKDGSVFVAGGFGVQGTLGSAEWYAEGVFKPGGTLGTARQLHAATLLADGTVLLSGGWNGKEALGSFELFDPARGVIAPASGAQGGFHSHTATCLDDGHVLVLGGFNSVPLGAAARWKR